MNNAVSLTKTPAWQALAAHAAAQNHQRIADLFSQDANRHATFTWQLPDMGITIDTSKNNWTPTTRDLLFDLAQECDVVGWRARMVAGDAINSSEGRAVGHIHLRSQPIAEHVRAVWQQADMIADFIARKHIHHIIVVGIGGSDLGPRMVADALHAYRLPDAPPIHWVNSVDAAHMAAIQKQCTPATTLVLVASKSFGTAEILANANILKDWLGRYSTHMVAMTANTEKAMAFGIVAEHILPLWDWVGGRFSVWSAIGLPLYLTLGRAVFLDFLQGAAAMDDHFIHAPLAQNVPIHLGLLDIWQRNFMQHHALAVVAYDQRLQHMPAYIQQLVMESNGKTHTRDGALISDYQTAPIIFGGVGPTDQHAYFQMLHQGSDIIPSEFIVNLQRDATHSALSSMALANGLAQAAALMHGDNAGFAGNRPSTLIALHGCTPRTMGALLALYEHRVFVAGIIWQLNSFDQPGVELGKTLAHALLPVLTGDGGIGGDPSTSAIVQLYKEMNP